MSHSEPKELVRVKQLIDECKLDEADQLIKNFEEKGGHTLHDIVLCHLLNCELLFWRGLHKDVIKLAEQTYKESLGLGKNLLSVDILLRMADALVWHKQSDKLHDVIKQGEELLKTLPQELPADYKQREAYIAYLKGWFYLLIEEADQALKHFEYSLTLREELGAKPEIVVSLIGIAWVFTFLKLDYDRALKYSEKGMVIAKESGNKWVIGYCINNMAIVLYAKGDLDHGFTFSEQGLTIFKNINNEFMFTLVLTNMGLAYIQRGELDRALKTVERGMTIAEESGIKWLIGFCFFSMALVYIFKGDLDRGIMLYKQELTIFNDLNIKRWIANTLNAMGEAYRQRGELDRALECLEQGLALYEASGNLRRMAYFYDYLIQILIERGDLEQAQQFLLRYEQLNSQLKDKQINLCYLLNKALMLKTSIRARNRSKAEEILKQILDEKDLDYELTIKTLINLCELLLTELRMTNDLEVLEEINPLIARLLDIAEKTGSYSILCETYLLQAKLSLLTFDIKKAQRFLTQAQQIAERFGLKLLAIKISNEHDELLKQLDMWENLKESKAPLTERMELSRLNEQMEGMIRKRALKLPKLEVEQPVLLTIMTKEGNFLLSNPFTADITIGSAYFSEFLSSCNKFCDQILSESFDRVKFGQHTVLITTVDSFSICYMFQGQSYTARQKLIHFSEAVRKDPEIMKILQDAGNKNVEIKVSETSILEEIIYESFLSDPQQFQMPFKAYEGDGPFVFVSYSHTDRLQVYPIIDYLNKTGINIWYDEGIPVSEDWKSSIVDNLERCSAFLVFITPRIIDSEYVRKEISFALKKQKPFFSVYLKDTQLPSKLEFEIGDIQFINKYLMPETEFYSKLNRMLDPVLNK